MEAASARSSEGREEHRMRNGEMETTAFKVHSFSIETITNFSS